MAPTLRLRTVDRLEHMDFEAEGFITRRNKPARFILALCVGLVFGILCADFVLRYDALSSFNMVLAATIFIIVTNVHLERIKMIQGATEFMNAVLSSLVSEGTRFTAVVRNDGYIIYLNRGFQAMFPRFVSHNEFTVEELCDAQGVSAADKERFVNMLGTSTKASVPLAIHTGGDHRQETLVLQFVPVPKPIGYTLIRCE